MTLPLIPRRFINHPIVFLALCPMVNQGGCNKFTQLAFTDDDVMSEPSLRRYLHVGVCGFVRLFVHFPVSENQRAWNRDVKVTWRVNTAGRLEC